MTLVELRRRYNEADEARVVAEYERDRAARLVARAAVMFFAEAAMENLRRHTLNYKAADKAYGLALDAAGAAADALDAHEKRFAESGMS